MNKSRSRYCFYAFIVLVTQATIAIAQDRARHRGVYISLYPFFALVAIQLLPLISLIRRGTWHYTFIYICSLPVIWFFGLLIGGTIIGFGQFFFGGSVTYIGPILGLAFALVLPFLIWRHLLNLIDNKPNIPCQIIDK
jgi:hypothetical protein